MDFRHEQILCMTTIAPLMLNSGGIEVHTLKKQ